MPNEGYFGLSGSGTVEVLDRGRTRFAPSPGGRHRFLILKPEQKERVLNVYTEIANAKPVPRHRFSTLPQKQQQQRPEKKQ